MEPALAAAPVGHAFIERVTASPQMGVTSAFAFGRGLGGVEPPGCLGSGDQVAVELALFVLLAAALDRARPFLGQAPTVAASGSRESLPAPRRGPTAASSPAPHRIPITTRISRL